MCGIAGILSPGGANIEAVRAMNALLAHRGPDGDGIWTSPTHRCVLGHRRLAVIDLSNRSRQPMLLPERRLALTYNGEVYNYVELRGRLASLGNIFQTESDTEVILRAYAQWGTNCLKEFNGMFAFALWDEERQVLFCARDRFGEKPLFYALVEDSFAFASEAKALALLKGVDLSVDEGVLAAYAEEGSTRTDASERTLLRGVRQLLPANAVEVSLDGARPSLRAWRYWSVDLSNRRCARGPCSCRKRRTGERRRSGDNRRSSNRPGWRRSRCRPWRRRRDRLQSSSRGQSAWPVPAR